MSFFLSLFVQVVMNIYTQQLCMLMISKIGKSVGYLDIKDRVEKGSVYLNIQNTMNLKLIAYLKKKLCNDLEILNDYKVSHGLT